MAAQGHPARQRPQVDARRGAIYRRQAADAAAAAGRRGTIDDWYAFTIAFKGVLLEGLEVAFIVVTFGSNQGNVALAAAGALSAVAIVTRPALPSTRRSRGFPRTG